MKNQLGIKIRLFRFMKSEKAIGTSQGHISNIERSQYSSKDRKNTASSELLFKIANYFEFNVNELFALSGKIAVNMEKGI